MKELNNLSLLPKGSLKMYTGTLPEGVVADYYYHQKTLNIFLYFVNDSDLTKRRKRGKIKDKE